MTNTREIYSQTILPTYAPPSPVFVRGQGSRLWDENGREYIDFGGGIAVLSLGHCPPSLSAAISEQADTLMHLSNLHVHPLAGALAQKLCAATFADKVFLCNSGTEANEAALKLARRRGVSRQPEKYHTLSFTNSFHGRVGLAMAATGQEKIRSGFGPLADGFHVLPFNDLSAVAARMDGAVCAIIVEPIQGEGGVNIADRDFLHGLRTLADEHDALLIFDEIQSGAGRTGHLYAYEANGVIPDILTSAKGLGGGFPIAAMLVGERAANSLPVGTHGTTYGGNALACAAALAVLNGAPVGRFSRKRSEAGERIRRAAGDIKKRASLPRRHPPARAPHRLRHHRRQTSESGGGARPGRRPNRPDRGRKHPAHGTRPEPAGGRPKRRLRTAEQGPAQPRQDLMKLQALDIFVVGNPSPGFGGRYFIFVKLTTTCGIIGHGECYAATVGPKAMTAVIRDVYERHLSDEDPANIERLFRRVYSSGFSQRPDPTVIGAFSGLEIACWDILGKHYGVPIHRLLGGKIQDRLRSYTYLYPGDKQDPAHFYTSVEQSVECAVRTVGQGFTAIKFDPAGPYTSLGGHQPTLDDLERSEAFCRQIRQAIGNRADLLIGTHGQFTPSAAIRLAKRLEAYDPLWFEEPIPPDVPAEMATVAAATRIPIATGERLCTKNEFLQILRQQAANILQPALGRVGGIWEAKKIAILAESFCAQIAPHCYAGPDRMGGKHSARRHPAQPPATGKHRHRRRISPPTPDRRHRLGSGLCPSAHRPRSRRGAQRSGRPCPIHTKATNYTWKCGTAPTCPKRRRYSPSSCGNTTFSKTANTAAGNNPETSNSLTVDGKCPQRLRHRLQPQPKRQRQRNNHHIPPVHPDLAQHPQPGGSDHPKHHQHPAAQNRLRHRGDHRANFRNQPATTKKAAPIVTTWRLITPVIAIKPTFWLNEVFGKPPNTAANAVPAPSAIVPPPISLSVASRPAPPFVMPEMSPTVSMAETTHIRHMPMTAAAFTSKPKWNGFGTANHPGTRDILKIDHAGKSRDDITDNQTDKSGGRRSEAADKKLNAESRQHDKQRQPPMIETAEQLRLVIHQPNPSGRIFDADRYQRQTDSQNNDTRHQRRQKPPHPADNRTQEKMKNTANQRAAQHSRNAPRSSQSES